MKQTKSKRGNMNLSKYAIVPSTKKGKVVDRKWRGPRAKLLVGSSKRLARVAWDKQRSK